MNGELKQDFLYGTRATLTIARYPDLTFYCQDYGIPKVDLPSPQAPTVFVPLNEPGSHLNFDPLSITFIVDEYLENYTTIFNWMKELAPPQRGDQYKGRSSGDEQFSDGILTFYSNQQNPVLRVQFYDMFPMSLNAILMSTFDETSVPKNCQTLFSYRDFDLFPVKQ